MRNTPLGTIVLLSLLILQVICAQGLEKIDYFSDSIAEKEGSFIRLLGGSSWALSTPSLALVTDDVIIVFREVELRDRTHS